MRYTRSTLLCYVILHLSLTMVSAIKVQQFFPQIKNNLTEVTWAHAVNNFTYLEETLEEDEIMMIEADIVLGTTEASDHIVPIMGHPPVARSDLTLEQFMLNVSEHNRNVTGDSGTKKGVKLDFKTINALTDSVEIITPYATKGEFPIWINADILPGPIDSKVIPVNATSFFASTKDIPNITYSVGWTTLYGPDKDGSYSEDQIKDMLDTITDVKTEITFPVRAGLAAASHDQMKKLLKGSPTSTLTIWSSQDDKVNVTDLNTLINDIGVEKIYIDVPEDLMDQIVIKPEPHTGGAPGVGGVLTVALVVATAMFTQIF